MDSKYSDNITELKETYKKLENSYKKNIEILRLTVDAKDVYTMGHSDRVSNFSLIIGKYLNLSKQDMKTLKFGSLFHDIGKIVIPDNILLKHEKLTNEEYNKIKEHPNIGANLLSTATIFSSLLPIVKHHHEKYNGTGYPDKLIGENIPYLARIVSIADTFDAMTSKRPYRDAMPIKNVIKELQNISGTQLDPKITKVFLNIINNNYNLILEIQHKY